MEMFNVNVLTTEQVRDMISKAGWFEFQVLWIPKIMEWQTEDEVSAKTTKHKNGKGLSACDARRITKYHRIIAMGGRLTEEQVEDTRNCLVKYSGQYARHTKEKNEEAVTPSL